MSDQIVDYLEQLTLVELKMLDSACANLRESIVNDSPRSPESFIESVDEPQWTCMLLELIGAEIEARLDANLSPTLDTYLTRYPQFAMQLPQIFAERSHDHSRSLSSVSRTSASRSHNNSLDAEQMVGSKLGHYEIQSVIGRGGMGFVLAARDTKLDREVAIKLPSSHPIKDEKQIVSFMREAKIAAAVRHENIVTIHSVEEQNSRPFLVMERIQGYSLEQYVRKHGRMNAEEVIEVGLQIAHGLSAAHSVGLTHHDIKPSNILLESIRRRVGEEDVPSQHPFRVKLTDFGLAQSATSPMGLPADHLIGTPMYMSPEQASQAPMDARSDLFSLGSVLYFLISGKPPFGSGRLESVLSQVRTCQPTPLQANHESIPESLVHTIRQLMAKSPNDRPMSADVVIELLRTIQLSNASKRVVLPQTQPRSVLKIGLGLAIGMLTLVCGLVWFSLNRNEQSGLSAFIKPSTDSQTPKVATWSMPTQVPFVDGDSSGSNATLSGDGLRIIFLRRFSTGAELVEAKRKSIDEPFDHPQIFKLPPPHVDTASEQIGIGTPSLSADGLTISFYRMTMPGFQSDLWTAERANLDAPWQPMTKLDGVNTPYHEYAPNVSNNGMDLYWFHVDPDSYDNADIWTATRTAANLPFENPHILSEAVNSATNEQHPFMTSKGELLYFDRGTPEPRLWQATRNTLTGELSAAVRVELPDSWNDINAYAPTLSDDGRLLIFTSNTVPGKQGFETGILWQSRIDQ